MRRMVVIAAFLATVCSSAAAQEARPFGLGIIIGEPTGVNAKYYLDRNNAIQGSAAWSLEGNNSFTLQGDYLFHRYDWIKVKKGQLPVFFGIGAGLSFRHNEDNEVDARIPVGLDYLFDGAPIDIFGQLVPILELAPSTDFDFDAALGARYFF